jgi:hypothetical protein
VQYRVSSHPKAADAPGSTAVQPQSFVVLNSLPLDASLGTAVSAGAGNPARFCWQGPAQSPTNGGNSSGDKDETCADFTPGGKLVLVPQGVSKVDVHSPGRAGIEMAWDCTDTCAQMTIEPKLFSAQFRLQFSPLIPGGEASQYSMHIRVLDTP